MLYPLVRNILFKQDAEASHDLTMGALAYAPKLGLDSIINTCIGARVPECPTTIWGMTFKNPVGLAAGLDKHADSLDGLAALGFGFIEVGTVTPQPQSGNDKPRLFRLPEHDAIINRFGFNSKGLMHLKERVQYASYSGILGINIGKNKLTPNENAVDDYLKCLHEVYALADYVTVNISSPNTPNLRALQQADSLKDLINPLKQAQAKLADQYGRYVPLAVKIAPDLDSDEISMMADVFTNTEIDGIICSNTTLDRTLVAGHKHADEAGGLSGAILKEKSNDCLRALRNQVGDAMPIIGVGGINSGQDAVDKMDAGADLVQIYSGLIYQGPRLIKDCVQTIKDN